MSGSGSDALTLAGDLTDINSELATVTYTGALRTSLAATASDSVSIDLSDADGRYANQSVAVTVGTGAVVITAPQSANVVQAIGSSLGNLQLADSNGANGSFTVTLAASTGTLAATQSGTATLADDSSLLTLTGDLTDINSELASLTYTSLLPTGTTPDQVTIQADGPERRQGPADHRRHRQRAFRQYRHDRPVERETLAISSSQFTNAAGRSITIGAGSTLAIGAQALPVNFEDLSGSGGYGVPDPYHGFTWSTPGDNFDWLNATTTASGSGYQTGNIPPGQRRLQRLRRPAD